MKWSYGITTVPSRREDLFPRTLASLRAAGFDSPRIFIDGEINGGTYSSRFNIPEEKITCRYPNIRTYGNWVLSLAELYIREPLADRYALFQDDFVTCLNLRSYLESVPFPEKGYLNLYTFPSQQKIAPKRGVGWYPSSQHGRGAVALVFNGEGVRTLLRHPYMIDRPVDPIRGHKSVDGAIITTMRMLGWKEYVHNPSLTQHTGLYSSMGNKPHKLAVSFVGEDYDAMKLLEQERIS
jgi:hypothetical protein